jgi:hypothetical protein
MNPLQKRNRCSYRAARRKDDDVGYALFEAFRFGFTRAHLQDFGSVGTERGRNAVRAFLRPGQYDEPSRQGKRARPGTRGKNRHRTRREQRLCERDTKSFGFRNGGGRADAAISHDSRSVERRNDAVDDEPFVFESCVDADRRLASALQRAQCRSLAYHRAFGFVVIDCFAHARRKVYVVRTRFYS